MSCFFFVKNSLLDVSLSLEKKNTEATYQPHKKIAGFCQKLYIKSSVGKLKYRGQALY